MKKHTHKDFHPDKLLHWHVWQKTENKTTWEIISKQLYGNMLIYEWKKFCAEKGVEEFQKK